MARANKREKLSLQTNILQLPEEVIRHIFEYLDPETVYLFVRQVCKILKYYVDGYMKPEEVFVSSAGK
jgi:hypothetical protein